MHDLPCCMRSANPSTLSGGHLSLSPCRPGLLQTEAMDMIWLLMEQGDAPARVQVAGCCALGLLAFENNSSATVIPTRGIMAILQDGPPSANARLSVPALLRYLIL